MSNTRERVLSKLRSALEQNRPTVAEAPVLAGFELSREERIARLKRLMENIHTEVHEATTADWVDQVKELLRKRQFNNLLYAPGTPIGATLQNAWDDTLPPLIAYTDEIESFKEKLFAIDASITSTKGGIAESGALILWPDTQEPRLMSLVPSVHIAVLEADKIYNNFLEAMTAEHWEQGMPTNVLLISGPSKTADIELVLTFGVHGPKELIVFIVNG